jgi:hypothetical protein
MQTVHESSQVLSNGCSYQVRESSKGIWLFELDSKWWKQLGEYTSVKEACQAYKDKVSAIIEEFRYSNEEKNLLESIQKNVAEVNTLAPEMKMEFTIDEDWFTLKYYLNGKFSADEYDSSEDSLYYIDEFLFNSLRYIDER